MEYLPIFCNLQDKRCLTVGGGQVATHKAQGLLSAGATLRLVAPAITKREGWRFFSQRRQLP